MKINHLGKAYSSIMIHPQILKEVKTVAVDKHIKLSNVIEEALHDYLFIEEALHDYLF